MEQAVDGLERLDIKTKLLMLPKLVLGKEIPAASEAFRRFAQLVRIRNDLVHYKFEPKAPGYVADLRQRKVALQGDNVDKEGWPYAISSVKGLVWAHNVAGSVAGELAKLFGAEWAAAHILLGNYIVLPDSWIADQLRQRREESA